MQNARFLRPGLPAVLFFLLAWVPSPAAETAQPPARGPAASAPPAQAVFKALEAGDLREAEKVLKKRFVRKRLRLFLEGITKLEAGDYPKARAALKPLLEGSARRFFPFPGLWDAEAAIHMGGGRAVRKRLLKIFADCRLYRTAASYALHLLVMEEAWGEAPDEPCGLVPDALLGVTLATRLGLDPASPKPQDKRRYLSYVRERLPRAPILTLAGGGRRPIDSAPAGFIVVGFLSCEDRSTKALIRDSLLPLAYRLEPGKKILLCLVLYAPDRGTFSKTAREIQTIDRRGEALLLWTPRKDAFVAYGVVRPPFFLLIPRRYESGVCDWESPWGFPRAFVYRLRRRLKAD